jgi:superoxide dismutase
MVRPSAGDLKKQIEKDFGSVDKYIADLKASGMAARGWVWLVWWEDGKRLDQLDRRRAEFVSRLESEADHGDGRV